MSVWSDCPCAYLCLVYSFFVFVVVAVLSFAVVYPVGFCSAFFAAVCLAVMVFLEDSSADWAFRFGIFDVNFHKYLIVLFR